MAMSNIHLQNRCDPATSLSRAGGEKNSDHPRRSRTWAAAIMLRFDRIDGQKTFLPPTPAAFPLFCFLRATDWLLLRHRLETGGGDVRAKY
jgi:hypothetical protein